MDLEDRYNLAVLKAELLGIAVGLKTDKNYTIEHAVSDLVKIVDGQGVV